MAPMLGCRISPDCCASGVKGKVHTGIRILSKIKANKAQTVLAPRNSKLTTVLNAISSNEWWKSGQVALAAPAERLQDCKYASHPSDVVGVCECPRNQRQRVELHALLNRIWLQRADSLAQSIML
jgi:hypothetical protein